MKKKFYVEPLIDRCEVGVELGIAVSDPFMDLTPGGNFDENVYDDEL